MKITKVSSLFKKFFSALILSFLVLITAAFSSGFIPSEQGDVSSYGANAYSNVSLYEVESFYNIVILTELADADKFTSQDLITINKSFNDITDSKVYSLREYFKDQSGGKLDIISVYMFCPSSTTINTFIKMDSVAEVSFANSALNGTVYKDINKNEVFNGDLDANNDGLIDSVTLFLSLTINEDYYDTAAWPHTRISSLNFNHTFRGLNYNRFVINSYRYRSNLTTIDAPIGVMCHEMLHNIGNDVGIQDLYHYSDESDPDFRNLTPVGNYCIMASTDYQNPQPLNIYYKFKLGWATLTELEIGEVSLLKTKSEGVKFGVKEKYVSGVKEEEFFIAQYWPANNYNNVSFNPSPSRLEGVIIYRVDTAIKNGNMGNYKGGNPSKKDEIYVFRQGENLETSGNFSALKTGNYKNFLTYSNGESAKINVKIDIGINSVNINIERYALEFKLDGKIVPYEISVKLNGGSWGQTLNGAYIFAYEDRFKKIEFESNGYKFYKDSALTIEITYVELSEYNLDENFIVTVYVKAIPRDIVTVYFKDFEGNDLGFNLESINYAFNNLSGTFAIENYSIEFSAFDNFKVKNGDKIYLTLEINGDSYKVELLEITPDIETTININLKKLCSIEGTITSRGKLLVNVKVFVDGKYFSDSIPTEKYTDSKGKFTLEDVPQGAIVSFELKNYEIKDFRVTQDDLNLSIKAKNLSENSIYIFIVAAVIVIIIITAALISVSVSKRRHSYLTNEHYDE